MFIKRDLSGKKYIYNHLYIYQSFYFSDIDIKKLFRTTKLSSPTTKCFSKTAEEKDYVV